MKCQLCGQRIEEIFLKKIMGTVITKGRKKTYVCSNCQKVHKDKLMEQLSN